MFFTHCRNFCNQLVARSRERRPARSHVARPCVEGLENRNLLSITFSNGIITVIGDDSNDTVTAQIEENDPFLRDTRVVVTRTDGKGNVESERFYVLYSTIFTWERSLHRIDFYAGNGTNKFDNQTYIESWAYGGNDADHFYGSSPGGSWWEPSEGKDFFYGGGGDDYLFGRGGDDTLLGDGVFETGNDRLYGGEGHDALYGGLGHDYLYGEAGDDFLSDRVTSGAYSSEGGNDCMYGGDGNDRLFGYSGNDWMYGGAGNDQLFGFSGWDHLYGGDGDDELDGGQDGWADALYGGSGADKFKAEWYWQSVGDFAVKKNRDQPQDFWGGEDLIVSPPLFQ